MKRLVVFALSVVFLTGCGGKQTDQKAKSDPDSAKQGKAKASSASNGGGSPNSTSGNTTELAPVQVSNGTVELTPDNTQIEFVGTHVGEPNPRTGGFKQFKGTATVDAQQLKSISVEIQTESLWSNVPGDRLTEHLKNEDFLDVRQHPTASFKTTAIVVGDTDYSLKGELTMLGKTNPIEFPAKVTLDDNGLTLTAAFTIDRVLWGMDRMQDRVEKEVSLTVKIGSKTSPRVAQGGRGGGRGRGSFDPAARFKEMDANSDGKLAKDELSERIRDRFESMDGDKDGGLTLEEFQAGIRQMFQGRGRGGRGRGGQGAGGQGAGGQGAGGQGAGGQGAGGQGRSSESRKEPAKEQNNK